MNDSDTEFIAEEKITQTTSTEDTSLTTPEANNLFVVPSDNQSKKKEKNKKRRIMEVDQKSKSYQARRVSPRARNTTQSEWNDFPIEIFSLVTGLEALLELTVEQSNLYAHQNGRNFIVTKEELKAFLGITFFMAINKFSHDCWILESR